MTACFHNILGKQSIFRWFPMFLWKEANRLFLCFQYRFLLDFLFAGWFFSTRFIFSFCFVSFEYEIDFIFLCLLSFHLKVNLCSLSVNGSKWMVSSFQFCDTWRKSYYRNINQFNRVIPAPPFGNLMNEWSLSNTPCQTTGQSNLRR